MGEINVGQVQVLTFKASKSFIDGVVYYGELSMVLERISTV